MQVRARSRSLLAAVGLFALGTAAQGCAFSHPEPMNQARMLVQKRRPAEAAQELEAFVRKHTGADSVNERRLLIRVYASMVQLGRVQEQAEELAKVLDAATRVPLGELAEAQQPAHRSAVTLAR